jgi:hypothetical protein
MEKVTKEIFRTLIPVHNASDCCGHLLRSARGFKAYDATEKLIGIYATAGEGLVALLGQPTDAI